MFFKIEKWNFQHLFETECRETSQNFNSIRQPMEKMKITNVWMSKFCEVSFIFKQMLKVSAFFLEKQKSFIPKKTYFKPLNMPRYIQKMVLAVLIFSEGFAQTNKETRQQFLKMSYVQAFYKFVNWLIVCKIYTYVYFCWKYENDYWVLALLKSTLKLCKVLVLFKAIVTVC